MSSHKLNIKMVKFSRGNCLKEMCKSWSEGVSMHKSMRTGLPSTPRAALALKVPPLKIASSITSSQLSSDHRVTEHVRLIYFKDNEKPLDNNNSQCKLLSLSATNPIRPFHQGTETTGQDKTRQESVAEKGEILLWFSNCMVNELFLLGKSEIIADTCFWGHIKVVQTLNHSWIRS